MHMRRSLLRTNVARGLLLRQRGGRSVCKEMRWESDCAAGVSAEDDVADDGNQEKDEEDEHTEADT